MSNTFNTLLQAECNNPVFLQEYLIETDRINLVDIITSNTIDNNLYYETLSLKN